MPCFFLPPSHLLLLLLLFENFSSQFVFFIVIVAVVEVVKLFNNPIIRLVRVLGLASFIHSQASEFCNR